MLRFPTMLKLSLVAVVVALGVFSIGVKPAAAAGNGAQQYDAPVSGYLVSCSGEFVYLSGYVHETFRAVTNSDGSVTVTFHTNYQDVHGVGLTSGLKYNYQSVDNGSETFTTTSYSITEVENFHLNGQGAGDNLNGHVTVTFGYDPVNGYTVTFSRFMVDCS